MCMDEELVFFSDIGQGRVAGSGSRFVPSDGYWLKVEGARKLGFRSIAIGGVRDPVMIAAIETILPEVRAQVETMMPANEGTLHFHVYGRDGVMGRREPLRRQPSHELGIVIDAVAPTPEGADTLCSLARSTLMHFGYAGRISTAGNLAFPFSPSDLRAGAVYEFSVYHLLESDPVTPFPLTIREVTG